MRAVQTAVAVARRRVRARSLPAWQGTVVVTSAWCELERRRTPGSGLCYWVWCLGVRRRSVLKHVGYGCRIRSATLDRRGLAVVVQIRRSAKAPLAPSRTTRVDRSTGVGVIQGQPWRRGAVQVAVGSMFGP